MKRKSRAREYTAQFYKGNHASFVIALVAAMLTAAVNLWTAWILQQMIDAVSGIPSSLSLMALTGHVTGVVLAVIALKAVQLLSKPRFMEKAMKQYKDYAFHKLTRKSIAAFQDENTADYISAFSNDAAAVESGCLDMQFSILGNGIMLVGALLMMILYSPVMTVVACAFFVLPIVVSYLTGDRMEKAERKVSEKNSQLVAVLQDALSGFSVIKSFKAENSISDQFEKCNSSLERAKCSKRKLITVIGGLAGVAGITAQLGTFLVGAYFALSGWGITPGILIVFIDLTAYVINPIRELPEQLASRRAAKALIHKLADSLEDNVRDQGEHIQNELKTGISVKNLNFGYESGSEILHDISTTFDAGKNTPSWGPPAAESPHF